MPIPGTILLAEDEPDDAILLQMALQEAGVPNPVQVVRDGEAAVQYLAAQGKFAGRTPEAFPKLLLLDLKMPVKTGFDVLQWINDHPDIKGKLVVVVLSSALVPSDLAALATLCPHSAFEKPLRFEVLVDNMRCLKKQWLDA